MNLNDFELTIHKRDQFGTSFVRKMRHEKKIPANFYGVGNLGQKVNFSGWIDLFELQKALASKTFFNMFTKINYEGEVYTVFAKVVQKDSLTDKILHIDFQVVSLKEEITMKIPVHFCDMEICEDLKLGGVLNVVMDYVALVATPENMPKSIEYSLKNAKAKVSLKLTDIALPANVKFSSKILCKKNNLNGKKNASPTVATILVSRKKNLENLSNT